ncbi:MAG: DUF3048 domain-containing protein [Clostridia bacterium]
MKKTGKILLLLMLSLLCVVSFSACGGGDAGGGSSSIAGGDGVVCPLDGQTVDAEEGFGDYILITSIDNGADSEPQSGIGQADFLIELPVEGGITRFMAFFYHSTPDTIGPIRSARHYFYDIITAYDGVMCHCGGSAMADEIARSGAVKDIDEMSCTSTFWRSDDRKAPHNLYTSYDRLSEKAAERDYNKIPVTDCPSFNFMTEDDMAALASGSVKEFSVPYRYKEVSYRWDEESERYLRYSGGEPHMDAIDDTQVAADNVAVLYIPYSVMDDVGHLDMDIESGEGHLFIYGGVTKINWTLSEGTGFVFTDASTGEEMKLIPGKTIIQIASPEQKAVYTVSSENEEGDA